ncbi:MAG: ribonuclease HII [Bacteroidota bacterium]|nr:ribonuclease HII [Bacteroidota bacterium]
MLKTQYETYKQIAGCDEAGRGCLAGPVYAAAVILHPDKPIEGLDDSKKLSKKKRDELRQKIEQNTQAWAVARVSNTVIDKINILNASILAMQKAVKLLNAKPDFILVDGNRFKPMDGYKHACIIKGDSKYAAIAAASILAKTHRDEFMEKIHAEYSDYFWNKNKGYPTKQHRKAITENGITKHHRKSFRLVDKQTKLKFKK